MMRLVAAVKDQGPCLAINEHPRRATDVILRQSKAPIELFNNSGFTRIGSRIKDLGPCFSKNGTLEGLWT